MARKPLGVNYVGELGEIKEMMCDGFDWQTSTVNIATNHSVPQREVVY